MRITLICPVRNCDEETKKLLDKHVAKLEAKGHTVHYPPRDADQTDDGIGMNICKASLAAMKRAVQVHVYWEPASQGSRFDLGMAFAMRRVEESVMPSDLELPTKERYSPKFVLINNPAKTAHKSYTNVLRELTKRWHIDEPMA